jgi:hypothetical protein
MEDNDLNRRVEIMSEMLHEQRETNTRLGEMNNRIKKLEDQQIKTNLGIGKLRLSVIQLADLFEAVLHHEKRIDALEKKVFK